MSVLIKGMDMPKDCNSCCATYLANCNLREQVNKEERHPNCPLIEVLTPHGRLIDADSLKEDDAVRLFHSARFKDIDEAPTVIEAEEEEYAG